MAVRRFCTGRLSLRGYRDARGTPKAGTETDGAKQEQIEATVAELTNSLTTFRSFIDQGPEL